MLPSRANNPVRRGSRRAFTLIELIFVMVLLAIGAAMVAPRMGDFFRGRVVSSEARRMLSLVHYGQSRAISRFSRSTRARSAGDSSTIPRGSVSFWTG